MTDDVKQLREAILGIMPYRDHVTGCVIEQTDFCTCGLRQAADAARAALRVTEEAV